MQELWASASYEPHLLSLPFAFAPAAMLVVIAYGLVMRGEPILRAWLLLHFVSLIPYATVMTLSPSVTSPAAAEAMFRVATALVPMVAAAGAGFQLRLLGLHRSWRVRIFVWSAVAVAIAWIVVGATTNAGVLGVRWIPAGLWYPTAGTYAWLAIATTLVVSTPGFVLMTVAAIRNPPSDERRQLRLILLANLITYSGLVDILLAYGVDLFPLGWLVAGIGSVLVMRALVFEDLLRVRAVDTTAPQLILHAAGAILLGWAALDQLGDGLQWWGIAITLGLCFASVRVTIAVAGLVNRGARGAESTLDRLLGQLVVRARALRAEPEVAKLAIDIIELGLGVRVQVLLADAEDWGWRHATGERIDDAVAPDPLVVSWLVEQTGAVFADDLELRVPPDLHDLVRSLFDHNRARAILPVTSHDELLALLIVPAAARRQRAGDGAGRGSVRPRGRSLAFLDRAADRLGEAIVHARMAARAESRAILAREVELAATVQAQLLPGKGPHVHGDVTVVGSWMPATRCAGDFWGVYALGSAPATDPSGSMTRSGGDRVLVAIGDVTGHGVASATVTAAAAAACDVAVRRYRDRLELEDLVAALDAAVRRVGGNELSMTCFAAIFDPTHREIRFVSCGHTTPYLCRLGDADALELHALVARGNPLGGHAPATVKVHHKPLRAGDLVVWYTDGVIDAKDPTGRPFGDRTLQRMLKRLDRVHLAPVAVHDVIHAGVAAHRAGGARDDDETLVVGQWLPPAAASTERATSEVSS
jgi:serine phosphatase RsbU (regulator of sigma subunit)